MHVTLEQGRGNPIVVHLQSVKALYVTYPTLNLSLHPSSSLLSAVGDLLTHTSISVAHPPNHLQSSRLVDSGHLQEGLQV